MIGVYCRKQRSQSARAIVPSFTVQLFFQGKPLCNIKQVTVQIATVRKYLQLPGPRLHTEVRSL